MGFVRWFVLQCACVHAFARDCSRWQEHAWELAGVAKARQGDRREKKSREGHLQHRQCSDVWRRVVF